MRKKKVWRYYCDHCNKGGCSGGCMKRHEASCCRNPSRVCGMCAAAGIGPEQKPTPALVEALGGGDKAGVERLREAAQGCPACMLSAIIASDLQEPADLETGGGFHVEFDFKKERDEFWKEVNSAKAEAQWPY